MKKTRLILIGIIILFLVTRFYKILEIPPSVYWDEASIGYNAYSISIDGKDEWGEFLPLHFRAFGEFKLPVYIYATVIFVKIFGLNEFSVRFPSVLFSLGAVILTYVLARKLTGNLVIGLWSSFFVTISPWFFIFSRTGYEATAGLVFYLLGLYLFLCFKQSSWNILISTLSFILSIYSYNSFKIIIPITVIILIVYEAKNIRKIIESGFLPFLLSVILLFFSIIPIYRLFTLDSGLARFQMVSTNKEAILKNYFSHFKPDFLLNGDKNLRSQQLGFGQLYLPELILLPLGFLYMIRSKSKYKLLPLMLLILGPIPAAITKESPHALRAIVVVPFISIISAIGVTDFGAWIKNKNIINLAVVLIFLTFFMNYFLNFLNIYPTQSAKDWQYDYKKIFTDPKLQVVAKERILISDKYAQPYIFALFYLKYDPEKFRDEVVRNSVDQWGFSTVKSFGRFEFGE